MRASAMHVVSLVAALTLTAAARAQQAPAAPRYGAVSGAVVDSIRGGLLSGAVIALESGARQAVTDSLGRFLLDSIPLGSHRLVLLDDLLDTLSLSVVTPVMNITGDDTAFVIMAVPSPETVVRTKCGPGPFPMGGSALLGVVIDADSEQRVRAAEVVLAWSEVQAGRDVGLRTVPRQRTARVAEDGSFRICGLPSDIRGELMAWSGTDTTAAIPFSFDHPQLALRTLALPGRSTVVVPQQQPQQTPRAAAGAAPTQVVQPLRRGRATVSGRVTTISGAPIVGARITVAGAEGAATTDERGHFVLSGQPAGSQTVQVRKLGYEPTEFGMNLSASRTAEVDIELPEFVPVLSTVVVRAQMDVALDKVGFTRRKQVGMGRFMGLQEIERRNALRVVDLLAEFPMLRAVSTGGTERRITGRSRGMETNCVTFYVDGMIWMGDDAPTDYMHPQEIAAVEAYSAGTTPAEFSRSLTSCETVVIWTKHRLGILR